MCHAALASGHMVLRSGLLKHSEARKKKLLAVRGLASIIII